MAKKKRVTRKQLLKEPDEFLTLSGKVIRYVSENQKLVFGIVIGAVVVLLVFAGFRYFSMVSERNAYAMFEQGRLQYLHEISGNKKAQAGGKAAEQFEKVINKYPSTNAARLSLIINADLSYYGKDYQKAIELYQKALEAFSGEGDIQKLIWNGLAHACEAKKDFRLAATYFQKITEAQEEFMKADAYYNLGRMMDAINQPKKALEAYNKVVQDYPWSASFRIAKEKVSRLP